MALILSAPRPALTARSGVRRSGPGPRRALSTQTTANADSLSSSRNITPGSSLLASRGHAAASTGAVVTEARGRKLDRPLKVAVIGGGPAGSCTAEILAKAGIETVMIERKLDNVKPCGGAIPICMIKEFDLPDSIIDRKVTKMKMISPSNVAIDVGKTLNDKEYIGMCRREVFDDYLRKRAESLGTKVVNGMVLRLDTPSSPDEMYKVHFSNFDNSTDGKGVPDCLEVDVVVGADGANSRVAKEIDAGEYDYAMAFQERIAIDPEKMAYYNDLAEMYVGDDVSPDFYGWVFPKYDHVAVGTGTVVDKKGIKKYQDATRVRASAKIEGGKLLRVEAHPIPEHPRPRRVRGRAVLVGDAAGYVTKCSGEGIYFAAKSGRMCAEAIVERSQQGQYAVDESDLRVYLDRWDKKYATTYRVLDLLQKLFYRNNPAREAFVELCDDTYVQKMTFDSYLYKTVVPGNPLSDLKLLVRTLGCVLRSNALKAHAGTLRRAA